jgi:methyl-accepting chemotaxis protein
MPDAWFRDESVNAHLDEECVPKENRTVELTDEARACRACTLGEFLRGIQLDAVNSGPPRGDLLLAYYGVERTALAEPLTRAHRDLLRNARLLDVAEVGSSNLPPPRFLLFLPQLERGDRPPFSWQNWLREQNRRHGAGDGRPRVRLLTRLTGEGAVQYFVEHGWNHPLPDAASLYAHPDGAHYILLTAEGSGVRRTHWTILSAGANVPVPAPLRGREAFDLRLEPAVAPTLGSFGGPAEPLRLTPRLIAVDGESTNQMRRLDKRIQEVQSNLYTLQLRRQALQHRPGRLVRLLLRFRQSAGAELAAPFRRFLELTWHQRGDLEYCFQDLADRSGWHIVRTRELVLERDLPHGLADGAWYQPEEWDDQSLAMFIRLDCALSPPIDRGQVRLLADDLRASLGRAGVSDGGRQTVLLDPDGPTGLKLTALPLPEGGTLEARLGLFHADFPVTQGPTRATAREDMRAKLDDQAAAFETEIEEVERRLVGQADVRLREAQRLWNEVAGRIATDLNGVEACGERTAIFAAMLADFQSSWQSFVAHVLSLNDDLISAKLTALAELERSRLAWRAAMDRVDSGNEVVNDRLGPAEQEIRERLRQAQGRRVAVRAALERTVEIERAARQRLTEVVCEIEDWLAKGRITLQTIEAANRSVAERRAHARTLLADAEAAAERLRARVEGFRDLIRRIGEAISTTRHATDDLATLHRDLPRRLSEWQQTFDASQPRLGDVRRAYDETSQQIDRLRRRTEAQLGRAVGLRAEIDSRHAALTQRRDQARVLLRQTEEAGQRLEEVATEFRTTLERVTASLDAARAAADRIAQVEAVLTGRRVEARELGSRLQYRREAVGRMQAELERLSTQAGIDQAALRDALTQLLEELRASRAGAAAAPEEFMGQPARADESAERVQNNGD